MSPIDRRPRAWPFSLEVETRDTEAETDSLGVTPVPTKSRAEHLRKFQFVKNDPRRHKGGRPKSFTGFRALIQRIIAESVEVKEWHNGHKKTTRMTAAEAIVRHWCKSRDPAMHRLLCEYAYGKVPDRIEATGLESSEISTVLLP